MSRQIDRCPLCDQAANFNVTLNMEVMDDGYRGNCERCGDVRIMQRVIDDYRKKNTRHLLSAFFRRYPERTPPLVTPENVDELLSGMPVLRTVPEKMDGLLKLLADSKVPPGTPINFDPTKAYPLIFAADGREATFLLGQLSLRHFVAGLSTGSYLVTANGYERVEQMDAASYRSTRNAFVAMWFDKSREAIWKEAIEPAILQAGYQPLRIDKKEHVNKIDDEIIAGLRESRFLVADFTGQRGGVYYEAGFMHGLGRNVFWLVDKKELGDVHFDVRQRNFIDYETSEDAKPRLLHRILAIEGRGPIRQASDG